MNQITIIGRLGKLPESHQLPTGIDVVNFPVAVNRVVKGVEQTEWFQVRVFGSTGLFCSEHLSKGSEVLVQGRVRVDQWISAENEHKAGLTVTAERIEFLGNRNEAKVSSNG